MFRTKLLSRAVLGLTVMLLVSAIILFVSISLTEKSLSLRWDRIGFAAFFELFDVPLKLLAAGFAVFITWITLIRVQQTALQLEILDDNNRFNNYYKQAEELHKFIEATPIFAQLVKSSQIQMRLYTSELHRYYFADSHVNFRPGIRQEAIDEIKTFFKTIADSQIATQNCAILQMPVDTLTDLSDAVDPKIRHMLSPLVNDLVPLSKLLEEVHLTVDQLPAQLRDNIQRAAVANLLYWTENTYRSLLAFQGFEQPPTGFFEANVGEFNTQLRHYFDTLKT